MKFLADMGVSLRVTHWLEAQGHDTLHLREQNLNRLPDQDIFSKALTALDGIDYVSGKSLFCA